MLHRFQTAYDRVWQTDRQDRMAIHIPRIQHCVAPLARWTDEKRIRRNAKI